MSFTTTTIARRPRGMRGLGAGPFVSVMTMRAGEAIGAAIASGRVSSTPISLVGTRSDTFTDTDEAGNVIAPDSEPGYTRTPGPLEGATPCECMVEQLAALDPAVAAAFDEMVASCEADPIAFRDEMGELLVNLGLDSAADLAACLSWYQIPMKRNVAIAAGVVAVVGGILLLRRRR